MKRFTISTENYRIIDGMSNEDLGLLFRAMFEYHVNNQTIPPQSVAIAFKMFQAQFDKDREVSNMRAEARKNKTQQTTTKRNKTQQNRNENQSLTLDQRKLQFKECLQPFLAEYGKDMLNEFYRYWTESNKSGKKMKFELETTWEVSLRLSNWARRDRNFGSSTTPHKEVHIPKV